MIAYALSQIQPRLMLLLPIRVAVQEGAQTLCVRDVGSLDHYFYYYSRKPRYISSLAWTRLAL
jgi:hypothetical protein